MQKYFQLNQNYTQIWEDLQQDLRSKTLKYSVSWVGIFTGISTLITFVPSTSYVRLYPKNWTFHRIQQSLGYQTEDETKYHWPEEEWRFFTTKTKVARTQRRSWAECRFHSSRSLKNRHLKTGIFSYGVNILDTAGGGCVTSVTLEGEVIFPKSDDNKPV